VWKTRRYVGDGAQSARPAANLRGAVARRCWRKGPTVGPRGHTNFTNPETATTTAEPITGKIQMCGQRSHMIMSPLTLGARDHGGTTGQNGMEWEEALLRAWGEDIPQSATYYRRKAARARQIPEGVTTRAVKARLLDEAAYCDELAADADRAAGDPAGL